MRASGRAVVVVFAKRPEPGRVKTRMTPPLSPEQAADFYAEMLRDVLAATEISARALDLEPWLAVHPPGACDELARLAPRAFRVVAQRGRDLSERMDRAVRDAAAGGAHRILLRGSDSPALEAERIEAALRSLDEFDLVLCPDRDGGYNLVGLRGVVPGLFDHPMSTRSVLEDTLANAASRGLRATVQEPSFDLDTVDDLGLLAALRRTTEPAWCRHTLTYADRHNLWRFLDSANSLAREKPPC